MKFSLVKGTISALVVVGALGLQGCFEQSSKDTRDSIVSTEQTPTRHTDPGADNHTENTTAKNNEIQISLHPLSQTVYASKSITLNTSATGKGTLKYQWMKDDQPLRDAVRSSLTIDNAGTSDAGVYSVQITSGNQSVMTRTATLTVTTDTSARISWQVPTTRVDGSQLSTADIAAYTIYHTSEDGSIGRNYSVEGYQLSYELTNLPSGAHHFAVATVDVNGMESDLSEVVTKRIM